MLNSIARKDKDSIHELNVQLRELQTLIQNLRDQTSRMEATESTLMEQLDQMQVRFFFQLSNVMW